MNEKMLPNYWNIIELWYIWLYHYWKHSVSVCVSFCMFLKLFSISFSFYRASSQECFCQKRTETKTVQRAELYNDHTYLVQGDPNHVWGSSRNTYIDFFSLLIYCFIVHIIVFMYIYVFTYFWRGGVFLQYYKINIY